MPAVSSNPSFTGSMSAVFHAEVTCIYINGRPSSKEVRTKSASRAVGVLRLNEDRHPDLGRTTLTANLLDPKDGCRTPLLKTLYDAQVVYWHANQVRIRGVEVGKDRVHHGQCWDLHLSPPS